MELAQFRALQKHVKELQSKTDRAAGVLAEMKTVLKNDFQCDSLKVARKKSRKLNQIRDRAKSLAKKTDRDFIRRFGKYL